MAATTLRTLPPPLDGVRYLIGDRTLQAKRGQQHPLGHTARHREHDPYTCGCEMVRLMASWDRFRIPLALVPIDPQCRGHQNILFRQMLKAVVPPAWARRVVVVADARFAANETLRLMAAKQYASVVAMPRTRKFTHGKPLRDMVPHRPKRFSYRRARDKPDGRRKDDWVFARRATLHHLGDVTIVLSKTRRHNGPKGGKIIVTHLTEASAGEVLSIYARRWGIEVTIKELKSGLHLGQMQVTKEAERVTRSVALSVLADLLLVRLYGDDEALSKEWSVFKLKERFAEEVAQDAVRRTELKWQRKLKQYRHVA
jgi:Transposase DDE domain